MVKSKRQQKKNRFQEDAGLPREVAQLVVSFKRSRVTVQIYWREFVSRPRYKVVGKKILAAPSVGHIRPIHWKKVAEESRLRNYQKFEALDDGLVALEPEREAVFCDRVSKPVENQILLGQNRVNSSRLVKKTQEFVCVHRLIFVDQNFN